MLYIPLWRFAVIGFILVYAVFFKYAVNQLLVILCYVLNYLAHTAVTLFKSKLADSPFIYKCADSYGVFVILHLT